MAARKYNETLTTVLNTADVVDSTYEVGEDGTVFDFLFDEMPECENPF